MRTDLLKSDDSWIVAWRWHAGDDWSYGPIEKVLGGLGTHTEGMTRIVGLALFADTDRFSEQSRDGKSTVLIDRAYPEIKLFFGSDGQLSGAEYFGKSMIAS